MTTFSVDPNSLNFNVNSDSSILVGAGQKLSLGSLAKTVCDVNAVTVSPNIDLKGTWDSGTSAYVGGSYLTGLVMRATPIETDAATVQYVSSLGPGGSDTSVQYKNGSAFGGSDNFTFVSGTSKLTIGPVGSADTNLVLAGGDISTTKTNGNIALSSLGTGKLVFGGTATGGVEVTSSNILKVLNTTASTSKTTGAATIAGGLGVFGQVSSNASLSGNVLISGRVISSVLESGVYDLNIAAADGGEVYIGEGSGYTNAKVNVYATDGLYIASTTEASASAASIFTDGGITATKLIRSAQLSVNTLGLTAPSLSMTTPATGSPPGSLAGAATITYAQCNILTSSSAPTATYTGPNISMVEDNKVIFLNADIIIIDTAKPPTQYAMFGTQCSVFSSSTAPLIKMQTYNVAFSNLNPSTVTYEWVQSGNFIAFQVTALTPLVVNFRTTISMQYQVLVNP